MKATPSSLTRCAGLALVAAVMSPILAAGAAAQGIPREFTNLEVLPKDIDQRALVDAMRGFSRGLGVRCEHCHVGEPGQPLSTFDFASDEKEAKRKARQMMRMVNTINSQHLAGLEVRSNPHIEVTCATCHHGQSRPRTLEDVLLETHAEQGLDATVERYRELRDRYHGSWTFDFSEGRLPDVASALAAQRMLDDALRILRLNLEFFPQSAMTHMGMGEVHLAKADTASAVAQYQKSLELAPRNRAAQRRLAELGKN